MEQRETLLVSMGLQCRDRMDNEGLTRRQDLRGIVQEILGESSPNVLGAVLRKEPAPGVSVPYDRGTIAASLDCPHFADFQALDDTWTGYDKASVQRALQRIFDVAAGFGTDQ